MFVARILYPVRVLGPGMRIGLWVSGCERRCCGCSNPELWHRQPTQEISVENLSQLLHRLAVEQPVDGITLTGGEPMLQAGELNQLLEALADVTQDVLLYTGYTLSELQAQKRPEIQTLLERVSVLIDGEYREELNDALPLRGSANQTIHFLQPSKQARYDELLREAQSGIQDFSLGSSIVSVGIHRADYHDTLHQQTMQKGLIGDE